MSSKISTQRRSPFWCQTARVQLTIALPVPVLPSLVVGGRHLLRPSVVSKCSAGTAAAAAAWTVAVKSNFLR